MRNLDAQHLLETHGLSTHLHAIAFGSLRLATLVLDRNRLPETANARYGYRYHAGEICLAPAMQFNYVGATHDTESKASDPHAASNANIPSVLRSFGIDCFVKHPSLGRETILGPRLLDMNEGTLSLTEHQVLES